MDERRTDGQIFRSVVKSKNFITEKVLYYKRAGRFISEVSKGDFMGNTIYGITTIEEIAGVWRRRNDLSQSVNSGEELDKVLDRIQNYDIEMANHFLQYKAKE